MASAATARCHDPQRPVHYGGRVRSYFVKAEFAYWDYVKAGMDFRLSEAVPFSDEINVYEQNINTPNVCRIGHINRKARYFAYTDATFSKRMPVDVSVGLNGPTLRALVGDQIEVHFKNDLDFAVSMHPHGVKYDGVNEGVNGVAPGKVFVYKWLCDELSGPASNDASSVNWGYHSHVDSVKHIVAGLLGHLIISNPACANWATAVPLDVDKEFFVTYLIVDENAVPDEMLDANIDEFCDKFTGDRDELKADPDFQESNLKHSINGRQVGNLPGLVLRVGQRTRWNLIGWGNEADLHSAHWHGQTAIVEGHRTDTVPLLPAIFATADVLGRTEGRWMHHCHVADHINAGMSVNYRVVPEYYTDEQLAATPVDTLVVD